MSTSHHPKPHDEPPEMLLGKKGYTAKSHLQKEQADRTLRLGSALWLLSGKETGRVPGRASGAPAMFGFSFWI